jgi:enoyl-CoA hydratase/carnithine racemase
MPTITCEHSRHLAHIRLNRPAEGNRLTMEMLALIGRIFTEIEADPNIRCALLTANGDDFSVGADLPDVFPNWAAGRFPIDGDQVNPWGVTGRRRRKPLVTVVQGQCNSGGLELALSSDICIAADDARFAFEEVRFGILPFAGGVFRMIRAGGWGSAMRYVLTSEAFGAEDALRMNMVALVRPKAEAEAAGARLAEQISDAAPLAIQAVMAQAHTWADQGEAAALALSVPTMLRLLNSRDVAEIARARSEGRSPEFSGQ